MNTLSLVRHPTQSPQPEPGLEPHPLTPSIDNASRQLESQFTQLLIQCMREASMGDPLIPEGNTTYRDFYDHYLASTLSNGPGIGLQQMIRQSLERFHTTQTSALKESNEAPLVRPKPVRRAVASYIRTQRASSVEPSATFRHSCDEIQRSAEEDPHNFKPGTAEHFVAKLWPHAQRAAKELGVDPRVLVAQAALETGWGLHVPQQGQGQASNNLFGIKATGWAGKQMSAMTQEYENESLQQTQANFRAYPSTAESFIDYVRLLKDNPRYQQVLRAGKNIQRFASELQHAGYASDPHYAQKLTAIAHGPIIHRVLQSFIVALR